MPTEAEKKAAADKAANKPTDGADAKAALPGAGAVDATETGEETTLVTSTVPRVVHIGGVVLTPKIPAPIPTEALQHPRVKQMLKAKELVLGDAADGEERAD